MPRSMTAMRIDDPFRYGKSLTAWSWLMIEAYGAHGSVPLGDVESICRPSRGSRPKEDSSDGDDAVRGDSGCTLAIGELIEAVRRRRLRRRHRRRTRGDRAICAGGWVFL